MAISFFSIPFSLGSSYKHLVVLNVKFIHDNKISHLCLHTQITKLISRVVLQKIIKLTNCLKILNDACPSYNYNRGLNTNFYFLLI